MSTFYIYMPTLIPDTWDGIKRIVITEYSWTHRVIETLSACLPTEPALQSVKLVGVCRKWEHVELFTRLCETMQSTCSWELTCTLTPSNIGYIRRSLTRLKTRGQRQKLVLQDQTSNIDCVQTAIDAIGPQCNVELLASLHPDCSIDDIIRLVHQHAAITGLQLVNLDVRTVADTTVRSFVRLFPHLKMLDIDSMELTPEQHKTVLQCLSLSTSIKTFKTLIQNPCDINALSEMLSKTKTLEKLQLETSFVNPNTCISLLDNGFERNGSLLSIVYTVEGHKLRPKPEICARNRRGLQRWRESCKTALLSLQRIGLIRDLQRVLAGYFKETRGDIRWCV